MLSFCHPKICTSIVLLDNAYAKFWGGKQRALWYVMVFSGVVNYQ